MTAVISLITVIALIRIIPKALQIPGLASTRAHYEFIVESASDAIVTYTEDGICLSWNKGAEKMFGYTAQERIGESFKTLFPPYGNYIEEGLKNAEIIKAGGNVCLYESDRVHKNGKIIKTTTTYSRLFDENGTVRGVCATIKDVTDKKDLEDQLASKAELLTQKAQLLSQQNKKLNKLNKDLKIKNEETDLATKD
ncbi:MAG: PAS domain-containing protein [Janthinobacterium lividum]